MNLLRKVVILFAVTYDHGRTFVPPSGFSKKAVEGALIFIKACYEDLQAEVKRGDHPNMEAAVDHEIKSIGAALSKLHINEKGDLVERDDGG